jgi:protein involved in polysaccharide export with SLBB domain
MRLVVAIVGCWITVACSSPTGPPRSGALSTAVAPAQTESYVIEPGDDLEIKFQLTPEINERQIVRPDGTISLQLVDQEIMAAGQTVMQLRAAVRAAYAHQLRDPNVTVLLREFSQTRIFVGGEVGLVGPQALNRATTVMQAILQAQGFKDTAEPSQVILYRQPRGQPAFWQILDLREAPTSPGGDQDVLLASLDIVFVPRSPISDVARFIELNVRRLLPVAPTLQIPLQ